MKVQFKIALLFMFLNSVLAQHNKLSHNSEWAALLDLRSSLGIRAKDWPVKRDPCSNWTGIHCRSGRVTGINLSGLKRTLQGRLNPRFAIDSLANFSQLESFNSSRFSLPGSIPKWFGQRLSRLQVLDLSSCSIIGSLPSSLGSLSSLIYLSLSNNSVTGAIPTTFEKLLSLKVLDLSWNLLTGSIPSAFSALENLTSLNMSSNFLSGSIPSEFGSLHRLKFLNLSSNSLSGSIPTQLANLSRLVELDFGHNYLSGSLPRDLTGLRSLEKLLIGNNKLEGTLPLSFFSNLARLKDVVLSWNNLKGELPANFLPVSHLRVLDVAGNNFTGGFPNLTSWNDTGASFNFSNNLFYGNLTLEVGHFQAVDLSSNYLQGLVPNNEGNIVYFMNNCFQNVASQRSLESCRKFYAERGLDFGNNSTKGSKHTPLPETLKSRKRIIYILAIVFGGLGFLSLLVLTTMLYRITCFKRTPSQRAPANGRPVSQANITAPDRVSVNLSGLGEPFTYGKILEATNNFSNTNLIKHGHSGDIYRGILEEGCPVVVKKVKLQSIENESYMIELKLLWDATHPRLIPLLGHCLDNEYDKCLVYKYMPNGDLSNSLYKVSNCEDESMKSLDWITRLKIAIGAAEALTYFHHECHPPLVHSDIQASSILLDDKYEVKLGSLSAVCAQEGNNHQNMISRFLQMPQSSGQGANLGRSSATCAYDVYCFGKVLLELVTGKIGISKPDDNSTVEWLEKTLKFISISQREWVTRILDQSLIVDEDFLEEVWAVAVVAKSCLNPRPSRRPEMKHVLKALQNPFKVVRQDFSSGKLRTTSSRRSWRNAFFGSWRHSSSDSINVTNQAGRESTSGIKKTGRVGSHSSANEYSSSRNRSSSEIFPEPVEIQDLERQDTSQLSLQH